MNSNFDISFLSMLSFMKNKPEYVEKLFTIFKKVFNDKAKEPAVEGLIAYIDYAISLPYEGSKFSDRDIHSIADSYVRMYNLYDTRFKGIGMKTFITNLLYIVKSFNDRYGRVGVDEFKKLLSALEKFVNDPRKTFFEKKFQKRLKNLL